jgi:hypothetical protein
MHVPFVCSIIQPYMPFAFAVFFAWGVVLHLLLCHFPHNSHSYKLSPLQVAGQVQCLLSSMAGLFIYILPEGLPLPHSLEFQEKWPLCYLSSFLNSAACFLFSLFFLFFPPGWGSVCPGVYADLAQGCLWEYHMLLSTHGGLHLPKQSGSLHLAARSPPGFSV